MVQERGQATLHCVVVSLSKVRSRARGEHAKRVFGPRRGTKQQQQPRCLQVRQVREPSEQFVLRAMLAVSFGAGQGPGFQAGHRERDHRAVCADAGVLASRAPPLERAVAHIYQEAGARVARNMRLADMNIDVPVSDNRRIEVVANGLPLWHGSQQAIDATIGSPVTRAGEAQPGADAQPGPALVGATRRKRRQTHPKLVRARRCRWCRSRRPVQYRSGHVATFACPLPCICPRSYAVRCAVRMGSSVVRPSGGRVAAHSAFAASFPGCRVHVAGP